jgi:adenine-specific DNA-methyltransferase
MSKSGPEKLKMETADNNAENIEKIARLFPGVITEIEDDDGKLRKGIDFDLLKQELSGDYVEGREERYEFTWVGKKQSIVEANLPIQKTLRPCIDESKNWENTENIFIEGDNLEALKLLQESYLKKIKIIYIDPPYNTGNDFIYNDRFVIDIDEYEEETRAVDELGNRLIINSKDRGRYHSDWCSMLYPRLKLAHNLLKDDGIIFISIDDNQVHDLRKIMDEIFGEDNFVAELVWQKKTGAGAKSHGFIGLHEYVLCYAKQVSTNWDITAPMSEKTKSMYNKKDEYFPVLGPYATWPLDTTSMDERANLRYPIFHEGHEIWPKKQWLWKRERVERAQKENKLIFNFNENEKTWTVRFKGYLFDEDGQEKAGKPTSILIGPYIENEPVFIYNEKEKTWSVRFKGYLFDDDEQEKEGASSSILIGPYTQEGTKNFQDFFDRQIFPFPKPVLLIKKLLQNEIGDKNQKSNLIINQDLILDFFSGSCTTAQAIMRLNSEDGGNRKFIMVQLPEPCDKSSEAYKAGFTNISEIGKERIRRAGEQIKTEIKEGNQQAKIDDVPKPVPDIGFRVYKIDDTNMKDVYYSAAEYSQETIEGLVDNVKENRTDTDLLYQILIDWGLPLDLQHEIEEIEGFHLHIVDKNALVACFDANIPESVMRKIAGKKPLRAVFRDGSFKNSPGKLNIEGIFKTIAPDTTLRVI